MNKLYRKTLVFTVLVAVLSAGLALSGQVTAEDLVELKLELPDPYFGGTPLDYFSPILEELSFKPREPFRILREFFRQNLDRDISPKIRVGRKPHLAHASLAEER